MIDKEALAAMPLEDLRQLQRAAEQLVYDRRCASFLHAAGGVACTAEPPHQDGWHEYRDPEYRGSAHPAHTATPHPAIIRWRFADDVVAREHAHEARRRPGAN